jgi:hypothetical protein
MTEGRKSVAGVLRQELAIFALLALVGVLLLPLMIYLVGAEIFGDYAGIGFGDFYRDIHSDLRQGRPVVVFLLMSPYLVWQLLRLSLYVFRRMAPVKQPARPRVDPEIR